MNFITLTARLMLNVHDLNNEATAGNVSDIRLIDYIGLDGKRREAPAVSGRMVKHWHQEVLTDLARQKDLPLCGNCGQGEPVRGPQGDGTEADALRACVICDIHGFLLAEGKRSERRASRALFSWLLPVLDDDTETAQRQVIHNRVSADPKNMMPFYKSYASGIYAFVAALDVARVGKLESGEEGISADEAASRVSQAVEAYRHLLTGRLGASQSHALPHADCLELLVAVSNDGPLPFPVSAIYPGYAEKYAGLLPAGSALHVFGSDAPPSSAAVHASINDLFAAVAG